VRNTWTSEPPKAGPSHPSPVAQGRTHPEAVYR
jgi:hypothetical protein